MDCHIPIIWMNPFSFLGTSLFRNNFSFLFHFLMTIFSASAIAPAGRREDFIFFTTDLLTVIIARTEIFLKWTPAKEIASKNEECQGHAHESCQIEGDLF